MIYEGFISGDRIIIIPTYRCQSDPSLSSSIRDYNNPGADYKPRDPIKGVVLSETLNGIWAIVEIPVYEDYKKTDRIKLERDFFEKDKYLFELNPEQNKIFNLLNS